MQSSATGVILKFDIIADQNENFNYEYRSELRETNNFDYYPNNYTTQMYTMRFRVDSLPELYGPMTIFQRFNVEQNGPDLEVELTGKNQFSNAVSSQIQVINSFTDPYTRFRTNTVLQDGENELVVTVYTEVNGGYKVSLNGDTLHQMENVDTTPSVEGTWSQFGLYPHGLHDASNRQDQIDSGNGLFVFTYSYFSKVTHGFKLDLNT